jgi:hypothetical protein
VVKRRFTTLLVERDFGNGSLRKAGEAHIRSPFSNAFEPVAQSVEHVTFNHGVQGSNPCGLTTLAETTDHRVTPGVTARRPRAGAAAAVGALFSAGYRGRLLTLSGALADDRGGTGFEAHGHDGRQLVEVLLKHGVRINEDGVFFVRKPRR